MAVHCRKVLMIIGTPLVPIASNARFDSNEAPSAPIDNVSNPPPSCHTVRTDVWLRQCADQGWSEARGPSHGPRSAHLHQTDVRLLTCTGLDEFVVVPFPSCPNWLLPQSQARPAVVAAMLWSTPPLTIVAPVRLLTCTGVVEFVVVPFPS